MAYENPFWKGIYNLLVGLRVTLRHLFTPAITLQYPTERWEMPERSRGMVVLLSDKETGDLNCTACILCQKGCPTGAIQIERHKGEDKRWKLDGFVVDHTICCYCGICQEACNFDALMLVPKYEYSTYTKEELIFNTAKLQEMGLDVEYTPKRPKKKPAPKPAAKPAADAKPKDEAAPAEAAKPAEPAAESKPADKPEAPAEEKKEGEA